MATGGLEPDLTLVLDLPPQTASARLSGPRDRLESRPLDYQQRVREGFRMEALSHPNHMAILDASGSIDQVQASVREQVTAYLNNVDK